MSSLDGVGGGVGSQLTQRLDRAGGLRQRRLEQRSRLRQRCRHCSRKPGEQHFARLHISQAGDLTRRQRAAVEDAALDHEERMSTGEVAQSARGLDRIALNEGDRRRTLKQLAEIVVPSLASRDLGQRVLDDRVRGIRAQVVA
jgi:hypothetical protein